MCLKYVDAQDLLRPQGENENKKYKNARDKGAVLKINISERYICKNMNISTLSYFLSMDQIKKVFVYACKGYFYFQLLHLNLGADV